MTPADLRIPRTGSVPGSPCERSTLAIYESASAVRAKCKPLSASAACSGTSVWILPVQQAALPFFGGPAIQIVVVVENGSFPSS
jgi:hypothetical protein